MSEFTKGPWIAQKGAGWFITRPEAMGRRESALAVGMTPATTLVGGTDWFDDKECEANCRMMAAAPELYEALKALWCDIVEYNLINQMPNANENHAMLQAVAALAKAEGKPK